MDIPEELRDQRYCLLSTQARVTGRRHTAELWFLPTDGGVHLMSGSGGLTTWCRNLELEEQGVLRIGDRSWLVRASRIDDDQEREQILRAFHAAYDPPGKDRTGPWLRDAVVLQLVLTRELER